MGAIAMYGIVKEKAFKPVEYVGLVLLALAPSISGALLLLNLLFTLFSQQFAGKLTAMHYNGMPGATIVVQSPSGHGREIIHAESEEVWKNSLSRGDSVMVTMDYGLVGLPRVNTIVTIGK